MRGVLPTALAPALLVTAVGCSDEPVGTPPQDTSIRMVFDLSADTNASEQFFDQPWPFALRLGEQGTPAIDGWPNPNDLPLVSGLRDIARERAAFPTVPVVYLRFTGPLAALDLDEVIAADPASPILLADVDADSPERGKLVPTVAKLLEDDDYVPAHVLAIAPRPGFVLRPDTDYAVIVRRSLGDASGAPLGVDATLADLVAGSAPAGDRGAAAAAAFAPLRDSLGALGVAAGDVAGATTFRTGNVAADLSALSSAILRAHPVTIDSLVLDPDDGATHERFCELHGTVRYPQFQRGTPPFETEGTFVSGADGLPQKQRDEEAPVVIALPKTAMPAGGYPLLLYLHGSGGLAAQVIDRGPHVGPRDMEEKGKGPAHVVAQYGIASAGSALPVNPERLRGAGETAYLNVDNLAAFRDTFRQGVIEQRLFLEALRTLQIPPEALAGCAGPSLPAGETSFHFADDELFAMGQSMGGLYVNLLAPTEPRISAVVPTGAGGFWSYYLLQSDLVPQGFLGPLLGTDAPLTFVHPALALLELAWEPAEPIAYAPAVARRPLPGHPARPIYEPVGNGDSYFPTTVYDAMAVAYGNEQAGDEVWDTMQPALALDERGALVRYPVSQNRVSADGQPYTGVVVQYAGDGVHDPHDIAFQLEEVKHQYGCFLASFLATGAAKVPAPAPLATPCPR